MKNSPNWSAFFFSMTLATVLVVFLSVEFKSTYGLFFGFVAALFYSFMFMRTALIYFKTK